LISAFAENSTFDEKTRLFSLFNKFSASAEKGYYAEFASKSLSAAIQAQEALSRRGA